MENKPTIVAIPDPEPVDLPCSTNDDYDQLIRNEREAEGKCPECETQLYEFAKSGIMKRKIKKKPLTIPGTVKRGQCLKCNKKGILVDATSNVVAETGSEEEAQQVVASVDITPISTNTQLMTTAKYTGEQVEGQRHGKGELEWSNGDKYVGNFWNGLRSGEGTLHFADGSEYVGNWECNKMHGQGTRRFVDGNVYTGEYREGKRSGQGRYYFANGDLYVGAWSSDQITGFGRYYYSNGQCFEGLLVNGKRHGFGKYQLTDGRVDLYRYENDKRVGEGVRFSKDRKKAWKLFEGKVKGRMDVQEASSLAKSLENNS